MKKPAGPAKAHLMTARMNLSISDTLIFALVKMTYINAHWWWLLLEPLWFCDPGGPAAFSSHYCCNPSFQQPFSHSHVQWNAAETRRINHVSIAVKWFTFTPREVRLHLWARWQKARLKKIFNAFCLRTLYLNPRRPPTSAWTEACLPRWLNWQDQVSNCFLGTFFNLRHDVNLIFNGFTNFGYAQTCKQNVNVHLVLFSPKIKHFRCIQTVNIKIKINGFHTRV